MLGLKAVAATRGKQRKPEESIKPREVPGFSKWITSEVYIEDKIAESSLEQLTLNMIENIEWINEAINDVIFKGLPPSDDEKGEVKINKMDSNTNVDDKNDRQEKNDAFQKEAITKNKDGGIISAAGDDDDDDEQLDTAFRVSDNSILLLKSPRRIRTNTSSPIQEAKKRGIELIHDTVALVLENDKEDILQSETKLEIETEVEVEDSIQEETNLKENIEDEGDIYGGNLNADDSFDLISKDIRKSFAAKKNRQSTVYDYDTKEVEIVKSDTVNKSFEMDNNKINNDTSLILEPLTNEKKTKSPEDEIKELSKLIDGVSDGLFSDDDNDEEFNIELDKFEKIELSQVKKPSIVKQNESPIKFLEMPTIEPLTLSRRKSSKRSTVQQQNAIKKTDIRKSLNRKPTIFNDNEKIENSGNNDQQKEFNLKPLPNEMFSNGNTSIDEPTIKLNRDFVKKLKYHNSQEMSTFDSERNDLLSRLMQPTESSRHRIKDSNSTLSPNKSSKTSSKSSPRRSLKLNDEEDDHDKSKSHKKEYNNENIIPSTLKILEAPKNTISASKKISPTKKQIPLTKKSLKTDVDYDKIYARNLDKPVNVSSKNLYQEILNKNKHIPEVGTISERQRLKSISKTNSRLNHQVEVNKQNTKAITENKEKKKEKGIANENILPDVIHTIQSDNDEEFNTDSGKDQIPTENSNGSNDWTTKENILKLLKAQQRTNPVDIFGQIIPVDCNKVFGKKYGPSMNIEWAKGDILNRKEITEYEKSMGWIIKHV